MPLSVTIGGVLLQGFEVPERLPVPLKQSVAINEFAGGTRTLYAMGAFPKPVAWTGQLLGATAFARGATLERIAAVGLPVTLAYGPYAWLGLLTEFELTVLHQWRINYAANFEPSVDLSGIGVVAQGAASAEQQLAGAQGAFDDVENGDSGLTLPGPLTAPAAGVDTSVTAGLLDAGGIVADIPTADGAAIAQACALVASTAAPLIAGTDPTLASPALDMAARAAAINAIVAAPHQGTRRLPGLVNPNLFMVAARYLGDATRWSEIAALSGLPPDPLPAGVLTLLVPSS